MRIRMNESGIGKMPILTVAIVSLHKMVNIHTYIYNKLKINKTIIRSKIVFILIYIYLLC